MATGVKRDILRTVIVLSVITLVAGILLSVVFQITRITPEEERQRVYKKLNAIYLAPNGYVEVESRPGESVEAFYKADGEDYYIVISNGAGYKGFIQLFVSFEGTELVRITVGNNSDTPGIKEDVFKESYLSQFHGDIYEKDYSQANFDAVAGATYTSGGVIAAARNAVTFYKNYLESKTPEQMLLEKLNGMHEARNGWVKIETDAQYVNGMYRAVGEDYYIVRSTGNGYRSEKREVLALSCMYCFQAGRYLVSRWENTRKARAGRASPGCSAMSTLLNSKLTLTTSYLSIRMRAALISILPPKPHIRRTAYSKRLPLP